MFVDREPSSWYRTALRYVLIAALILMARPILAQTVSSLQNGSFETGSGSSISNWTFTGPGSATILVKTASTTGQVDTGTKSVQMVVSQSGPHLGSSHVTVTANARYRFTARVRTKVPTPTIPNLNQQAELHVVEWTAGGVQVADNKLAVSSGLNTFAWDTLRGYLVPQPSTQSVEVRLVASLPAGGSATYYWDSVDMTAGDATAWEPWETTLTSNTDFSPTTTVNPYKDLVLTATFYQGSGSTCATPPSTCSGSTCFQGYGFWDGVPGATNGGKTFKLRTLFPSGNWCWATRCTGSTVCSSDVGLNTQSVKPLNVLTNLTPANKLYAMGMPKMAASARSMTYGDGTTTLPWVADTAWRAPVGYTPPSSPIPTQDIWRSLIWDRVGKGFTAILVAQAPDYVTVLPSNGSVPGFRTISGCQAGNAGIEPNECTYWDAPYWQNFDKMVRAANDAGLLVLVAGLIDPMDRSGTNTLLYDSSGNSFHLNLAFPTTTIATAFARNLAARLAGSYVIFSPGFDDFVTDATVDGKTANDSMEAVGNFLKFGSSTLGPAAVPRHLVVNHIAGGSSISNYVPFQGDPWLAFQFFQSGHGANETASILPCATNLDALSFAICRAREMALYFRCIGETAGSLPSCHLFPTGTVKPATNAEAAYDAVTSPDTRTGVRNTAYATGLSGSFGFTLGVGGVYNWANPTAFSTSGGASDLKILAGLFRSAPWTDLTPRHNMIVNNPTSDQARMVMAGMANYALLYAPNLSGGGSISLNKNAQNGISGLSCAWTIKWVDPTTGNQSGASCTGTGTLSIGGVPVCNHQSCDWLLKLTMGKDDSFSSSSSSSQNTIEVSASESPDGPTSTILAQVLDAAGNPLGDPIVVSPDGETFGKLPTVAQDASGNFLVAWQTEFPDGTLDTISSRWLDASGNLLGDTFQMDTGTDGQQAEPAITADGLGDVMVTWTAYSIDGSTSEIDLQYVLDRELPTDSPMAVSDPTQVAVSSSQVQASAQGSFVVAWNGNDAASGTPGVYFQRFNPHHQPVGQNRRVGHSATERRRLGKLAVDRQGGFRVRWESRSQSGAFLGIFEQAFGADGNEDGGEGQITGN
jgi:hypothetical protein